MIDPKHLLTDLQKRVTLLEDDLRARCNAQPEVDAPLRGDYEVARDKGRTGLTYSVWRDEELTQVAVAWILAGVFVRFLEDNELIDVPFLAGAKPARHQRAQDEHSLFFRQHPTASEREYFEHVFNTVGKLPGMKDLFDRSHNPIWRVGPTADAAKALFEFWRKTDPDTGCIIHDFTDAEWNTRFLGDLYQDLSAEARKRFALLQTPVFVEEFILDRTLTPAINSFGYKVVRMIDPTCGSGHFCMGAFDRLFRLWQQENHGENPRVLAQLALDGVYGVDLNPYAVAIAGFRLLLTALRVSGINKLKDAPDFTIHLAVGDSLLHGPEPGVVMDRNALKLRIEATVGAYQSEDADALADILSQHYHAVVGNPPYITVKDKKLNEVYREIFGSCHRKYSLAVPFMERFFDLAIPGSTIVPLAGPPELSLGVPTGELGGQYRPAGYVGMITANSFMKREFGKKLIEEFIPKWDLTHVIDTSGAYIPGHGTPTVILFGKHQLPVTGTIRTVMGIKGEPAPPDDPSNGYVWRALVDQVDHEGSQSEWLSVADTHRESFQKHPWSIGGGGASELREYFDEEAEFRLETIAKAVGVMVVAGDDEIFYTDSLSFWKRQQVDATRLRALSVGDGIRDYCFSTDWWTLFPYDERGQFHEIESADRYLWIFRVQLNSGICFHKTRKQRGLDWREFTMLIKDKLQPRWTLAYAEIATHNNFVLDESARAFAQTAPVVKLPVGTGPDTHYSLLGLLNSSSACFWLKQVCFPKGGSGIGRGIQNELWESRFAFDSSKLRQFPVPTKRPLALPQELNSLAMDFNSHAPNTVLESSANHTREALNAAKQNWSKTLHRMIVLQEELDWECYQLYGLTEDKLVLPPDQLPAIQLGQRAFEIVMARKMAKGALQTTWFERHGSKPITELPAHWPKLYRELVQRRIALIESDHNIALIEQPEYKRRWNTEPWDKQLERALREWLLNRLECNFFGGDRMMENCSATGNGEAETMARLRASFVAGHQPTLVPTNQFAPVVEADTDFLRVAEIYTGGPGFSISKLVRKLVEDESVPFLPFQRYKDTGLRKRQDWEHVWDLQREEDRIDAETARLGAEIDKRLTDLVQRMQPALVKAAATAQEALHTCEMAFHKRYHPNKPYDPKHPYWALDSFSTEQKNEILRLQALAQAQRDAQQAVAVARGELASKDHDVIELEKKLAALKKSVVPVPPKYISGDFKKSNWWKLRGRLDVPKERWIIYPGAERDGDPSPVIAWAGWDHLQQAKALAGYYVDANTNLGWPAEKLRLLLAGMADLLPWLKQWHNEFDPEVTSGLGDYFASFLDDEARKQGTTIEALNQMRFGVTMPQAKQAAIAATPKFGFGLDAIGRGKIRPRETPEFASFAEAYPSDAADKLVCALALEIVAWREGIQSSDHLDALILSTYPELSRILMAKGSPSQLDTWTAPIKAELKTIQAHGLKWVQCLTYLEEHRHALNIDRNEASRPIRSGTNFDSTRQAFPCPQPGIAVFALGLLDSIRQRRQSNDLSTEQTAAFRTIDELHTKYALA